MSDQPVSNRARYKLNVVGPFYVEDGCCANCGVPDAAPELFAGTDDHCYVKRQPQTPDELDAMVRVMATQEIGCIRYAGADAAILKRLAEHGETDHCDVVPSSDPDRG